MPTEISIEQISNGFPFTGDALFPGVSNGEAVLLTTDHFVRKTELLGLVNGIAEQQMPNVLTVTATTTLGLTAVGAVVQVQSSAAVVLSLPTEAVVEWPVNTEIWVTREGTGEVTITGAGGVDMRSGGSKYRINLQYDSVIIRKIGLNKWALIGALKA